MSIKVTDVQYVPSTSQSVQGVKNNQVPPGAIRGGNGSFITGTRPQVLVSTSDGQMKDFYEAIKMQTSRSRVTENYAMQVCQQLLGQQFADMKAIAQAIHDNL